MMTWMKLTNGKRESYIKVYVIGSHLLEALGVLMTWLNDTKLPPPCFAGFHCQDYRLGNERDDVV